MSIFKKEVISFGDIKIEIRLLPTAKKNIIHIQTQNQSHFDSMIRLLKNKKENTK